MGYLTTITLYNDALHEFKKHPEEFAKALFKGIIDANAAQKETSVGFNGYCNYISVQPSRHADDEQLYLHSGNGVFNMNPWRMDFEELLNRNPEVLESFVKRADRMIKEAKLKLKLAKEKDSKK